MKNRMLNLRNCLLSGTFTLCSLISLQSPAKALSTNSWSGTWKCYPDGGGHSFDLVIRSEGWESEISGYYPKAHDGKPATETYTIEQLSNQEAKGRYVYRDANPAVGPTGKEGVWTGSWKISVEDDKTFRLFRFDDASGWRGSADCL